MGDIIGDYVVTSRIGEGSYGAVYLATHQRTGERFAMKRLSLEAAGVVDGESFDERGLRHEAAIMQGLQHPHLVRLIQVIQQPTELCLVMELAEGGELFDMVITSRRFQEDHARRYFQQLISAIYYCHSQHVMHRDLKAENLLLSRLGQLKVCDFGFSKHHFVSQDTTDEAPGPEEAGTIDYLPPELLIGSSFQLEDPRQHDLWAAGVILYFMLTGVLPFTGRCEAETVHRIRNGIYDAELVASDRARALIQQMLATDPTDRIDIGDIIENEWFVNGLETTLFPDFLTLSTRTRSRTFLDFSRTQDEAVALTEEEREVFQRAFRNIAVDGRSDFGADELRDILIQLHPGRAPPNAAVVQALMARFGSASVTYDAFSEAFVKRMHEPVEGCENFKLRGIAAIVRAPVDAAVARNVRVAFCSLDADNDGVFSAVDVQRVFAAVGVGVEISQAQQLVEYISSHGAKSVSYHEFLSAVVHSDFLWKHAMGSHLCKALPCLTAVESQLIQSHYAGSGLTVCGDAERLTDRIANHSPERLRLVSSSHDEGRHDALFCLVPPTQGPAVVVPVASPQRAHDTCRVDVCFTPTHGDILSVKVSRLAGTTTDFHNAVGLIYDCLEDARNRAIHDISPIGDSELM